MCGFLGLAGGDSTRELVEAFSRAMPRIQHRGQESAGASWSNGENVDGHKGMGSVPAVFTKEELERIIKYGAQMIIGHTRYSTSGGSSDVNAQPHWLEDYRGRTAIALNGDVVELAKQKDELKKVGALFRTENDAEFILKKIYHIIDHDRPDWKEDFIYGIRTMMQTTRATYSGGLLTGPQLYIFRDPHENRPLFIGRRNSLFVAASETCVFKQIGAEVERSVNGGEIISVRPNGEWSSIQAVPRGKCAHCIFEKIYFARPDSIAFGQEICARFRRRLGVKMKQYEIERFGKSTEVDCACAVPDSGNYFTEGYAVARRILPRYLFVRDPYIARTFIMPGQDSRRTVAIRKYEALDDIAEGIYTADGEELIPPMKKIVIGEDSIVRLTTLLALIEDKVKKAGIEEIHVRISAPPIIAPCYYGIDMKRPEELIAATNSVEEIQKKLGVASLLYLPLAKLDEVIKEGGEDPEDYCRACFSGKYPI